MDLVISCEDFRRLSASTQRELLSILVGRKTDTDFSHSLDDLDSSPAPSGQKGGKRVVGINAEQATELLSNLAEKSRQTLRLFAISERVALDELVGEGRPYKDMNDLKRSFVGAVNRRLRTVVGNRTSALFSSDRDHKRIRVLPMTVSALRLAMGIAQPDSVGEDHVTDYDGLTDDEI